MQALPLGRRGRWPRRDYPGPSRPEAVAGRSRATRWTLTTGLALSAFQAVSPCPLDVVPGEVRVQRSRQSRNICRHVLRRVGLPKDTIARPNPSSPIPSRYIGGSPGDGSALSCSSMLFSPASWFCDVFVRLSLQFADQELEVVPVRRVPDQGRDSVQVADAVRVGRQEFFAVFLGEAVPPSLAVGQGCRSPGWPRGGIPWPLSVQLRVVCRVRPGGLGHGESRWGLQRGQDAAEAAVDLVGALVASADGFSDPLGLGPMRVGADQRRRLFEDSEAAGGAAGRGLVEDVVAARGIADRAIGMDGELAVGRVFEGAVESSLFLAQFVGERSSGSYGSDRIPCTRTRSCGRVA